jgi:hypothetical protein
MYSTLKGKPDIRFKLLVLRRERFFSFFFFSFKFQEKYEISSVALVSDYSLRHPTDLSPETPVHPH